MTVQCIFCSGYDSKRRKVRPKIVFNLEEKLLGVDRPILSKGVHIDCLNHFLGHIPPSTEPALFKFPIRASFHDAREDHEINEGAKPVWFLSKPLKFFLASGSRADGSFVFSFCWLRKVYNITETRRAEIPTSIKKLLPNQCENCGGKQNLNTHHKIPLCLGGSNGKENLQVLCKICHEKASFDLPPSVAFDFTKMLKEILEKEYNTRILCYTLGKEQHQLMPSSCLT